MFKTYRGVKIFFRFFDRKSKVVNVYLHGWGCSNKSLAFCDEHLKSSSLFVDFPPFGKSGKNVKKWTIFSYATLVESLLTDLNIEKINLIGHSFGGRISIILSALCKQKVEKLVLVDSAGMKPRRSLLFHLKVWKFKRQKAKGKDVSNFGSCDYRALSPNMKEVFCNVVNTHLEEFLPMIEAKTLIIFGKNDKTTPIYMAKRLKRKIKNSQLVLLENAGHFCFVERRLEFLKQLKIFLEE